MIKRTLTGWVMVAVFIALCLWIVDPAGGFKSIVTVNGTFILFSCGTF